MNGIVVVSESGLLLYADSFKDNFGLGQSGPSDVNLLSSTLYAMHKISGTLCEAGSSGSITLLQKVTLYIFFVLCEHGIDITMNSFL
jgi:hypothetical protein